MIDFAAALKNNTILDFHTHRMQHADDHEIIEIISLHLGQDRPHQFYTVGMHPWWTERIPENTQQEALEVLLSDPYCLAMGEMGLDKLKGPPLNRQIEILSSLLSIADRSNKPVIIHCVRAFDPLIQLKKQYPGIPNWCVHGYGRHLTLAKQLIDQGFYLSLMPGMPSEKLTELLTHLPKDRIFLETDSMPDISITEVYQNASSLLAKEISHLCDQINQNAINFFYT